MGSEGTHPPGTILRRHKPRGDFLDELKVVGAGDDVVVTSLNEFVPNFKLTVEEAHRDYKSLLPGDLILQAPTTATAPLGPSPEDQFRAAARDQAEAAAAADVPTVNVTEEDEPPVKPSRGRRPATT